MDVAFSILNHNLINLDLISYDFKDKDSNMFIGRNKEFQLFDDLYKRQDSCLAIVYGRRRVGKTEFIRRFCESKPHLYYACVECTDDVQLRKFSAFVLNQGKKKGYPNLIRYPFFSAIHFTSESLFVNNIF